MNFGWRFVGLKTGYRQGAASAHPLMGLKRSKPAHLILLLAGKASRNAAASPFSTQPSGPGGFWRSPTLCARARSIRILPLRSRLGDRQNPLRQIASQSSWHAL